MRSMGLMMFGLALCGVLIATLLDGELLSKRLAQGSLTALAAIYAYVTIRTTGTSHMDTPASVALVSLPTAAIAVAANVSFGLLSPFCVPVAIGLLLFGSAAERGTGIAVLAVILGGYTMCALAVHFGWYPAKPLYVVQFGPSQLWFVAIFTVELFFLGAFLVGRAIGANQTRVIDELERAVRQASMREALLYEAREALQNAAGLGAPGRFTDQELDGFRLGVVIGRGGMGEVYEAERLADGQLAAVKLLRLDALGDQASLSRFERETRIIGSIHSPNVVRVLGASAAESVLPYIAMERLRGQDLSTRLRDRGRMPLVEVVELVTQVAVGLSAAHAANVIHRDLKPNNLFRVDEGDKPLWKILDFGVAKWIESEDVELTLAEIVGTPQYMAPEQASCERDLDQRVDVYALAAIAYRALTGELPFKGNMPSILTRIASEMPRLPSGLVPLPHEVDQVLAIGLAKRRGDRFRQALEFAGALGLAARGQLSDELSARAQGLLAAQPYAGRA